MNRPSFLFASSGRSSLTAASGEVDFGGCCCAPGRSFAVQNPDYGVDSPESPARRRSVREWSSKTRKIPAREPVSEDFVKTWWYSATNAMLVSMPEMEGQYGINGRFRSSAGGIVPIEDEHYPVRFTELYIRYRILFSKSRFTTAVLSIHGSYV